MSQHKLTEAELESVPPVSGPRRRSTQPMFAPPSVRAERTPTQTGLSAPPAPPTASERVLRAVGLTRRPVRAPR
jgi:hypothetical protein